ncbi:MAG: RNA pyrophosphohydrolase [Endozoicomonadaceae bacterium]|nr:RNA pyrophosphohydrolase [Endozoicomonadaceae bacterium]
MLDKHSFRANVGIILMNNTGHVFWAKRAKQSGWQFPQGGIQENEHIESAMFRELYEETGLHKTQVSIIDQTNHWLHYKLPKHLIRQNNHPICIGQKQKWFLLHLISPETAINLNANHKPEFDEFTWVSYWYPIRRIVLFKQAVYRKALTFFSTSWINFQRNLNVHDTIQKHN